MTGELALLGIQECVGTGQIEMIFAIIVSETETEIGITPGFIYATTLS